MREKRAQTLCLISQTSSLFIMISFPWTISEIEFSRRNRRVVYYFVGLGILILVYTVIYNFALARLEGVNQSIFASFEFVVQTMTTTGYGQDSDLWSHPLVYSVPHKARQLTAPET